MRPRSVSFSILASLLLYGMAAAQTPGVLYTWNGTGNVYDWFAVPPTANTQNATVSNTVPGELTVTELGVHDDINMIDLHGGALLISDSYNRLRDSSTIIGGLDLTGLDHVEIDVSHTGSGNINAQFYAQVGPNSTFTWANLPDYNLAPNTNYTLSFPLSSLSPEERAYVRTFGIQTRDHASVGDVTWTISELRSVGTPLTVRDLATHNVGTSDNGLNGAVVNFGNDAVVGNDGGQNQTGLSQNTSGSGSLKWTDKGNNGVATNPSGAAISWANGTGYSGIYQNNTFYERPADVSNYDFLILRVSATDAQNRGGSIGTRGWFQTGNYEFRSAGGGSFFYNLPVDGQYHDLVYPLSYGANAIPNLQYTQAFGVQLFGHPNDADINVDLVRFVDFQGLPGDYNNDGVVNAGDYVVFRKYLNTSTTLPNDVTPGSVTQEDYMIWRYFFGSTPSGSGSLAQGAVPEPSALVLVVLAFMVGPLRNRKAA